MDYKIVCYGNLRFVFLTTFCELQKQMRLNRQTLYAFSVIERGQRSEVASRIITLQHEDKVHLAIRAKLILNNGLFKLKSNQPC